MPIAPPTKPSLSITGGGYLFAILVTIVHILPVAGGLVGPVAFQAAALSVWIEN